MENTPPIVADFEGMGWEFVSAKGCGGLWNLEKRRKGFSPRNSRGNAGLSAHCF